MFDPVSGDLSAWAEKPFQSPAEMTAAIAHPQYRNPANGAYRDAVARKLCVTPEGSTGFSARICDTEQRVVTASGNDTTEDAAQEYKDAEERLSEAFGAMAVSPSKLAQK